MSGIECPKCGTWKMHVGATTAERECENGHRFTVQGDRNPIPTEEYTADFLAHAAINASQYDRTCRVLAAEVIRNRAEIARLRAPWDFVRTVLPAGRFFYTDEERMRMTEAAGTLVQDALPPASENSTAFVLVVTTRAPEAKAAFSSVTNLDPRGAARLLVRAALKESEDGVADVFASLPAVRNLLKTGLNATADADEKKTTP